MRVGRAIRRILLAAAVATTATLTANADQYWVGGTSGLWSGDNWATVAGGTGGAWTSGNTGWFTTSPSTIDLAGSSQSATRFKTTGFSAANRCVVNITNSSEMASTLTFSGLNRGSDNDLAFTDLIIRNVAVSDSSTWGFEIFNGTHVYFGSGSSYTKPTANSNGSLYVGMFSATSNTITVAEGATMNVNGDAYIGCSRNDTEVACIGVVHVADGTLDVSGVLYMARSTSNNKTKNAGTGALVVDDGGTVNIKGNIEIGSVWQKNHIPNGKADIIVNRGGVLNCAKFIAWEYANKGRKVSIDGGTFNCTGNFESGYESSGLYKSRNFTVEVKNGGVLALGGNFYPNSYNGTKETVTFDNGTFRALGNISTISSSAGNGDYTDFTIGAGGMTIDTQSHTVTWNLGIDSGTGKVTKKGSGKLNLNWTAYNSGGFDVDEGTLSFGGSSTWIAKGPLTVKSGATLEKQTGNNPSSLASSVTFKDGAKLSVPYSGGAVGAVVANAITVEGSLDVSFSAVPAEGAYPLLTITGEGTFDEGVLSRINKPEGDAYAGALFALSADEKSVMLILSSDPVWIGGKSGNLGDPTKWSKGVVPGAGTNAIITAAVAATLTNSPAFKATTITFPAGCPKVTIEGEPLTDIEAINNLSSANHEFKVPVSGEAVVISNTTTYCVFTGGLTMDSVSFGVAENYKAYIYGNWHIRGDWQPVTGNSVQDGASVTVDGALLNPSSLGITAGSVVTAATMRATTSTYPVYNNSGRLVVTGMVDIANTSSDFLFARQDGQDATIIAGGIVFNTSRWPWLNIKTLVVGADGISFDSSHNNNLRFSNNAGVTLYASGAATTLHAGRDDLQAYTINNDTTLTICTTQFDSSEPSTITIDGKILGTYNVTGHYTGGMAVTGNGKLVFNSESTFNGGLTVGGTATVKVNVGCTPGTGTVTLDYGTTFSFYNTSNDFSEDPTIVLSGNGEGKATIKVDGKRLKSSTNLELITSGAPAGCADRVIVTGEALGGRKYTLTEDSGKLLLNIQPEGLMVIFR